MKRPCSVLVITGRTTAIKDDLIKLGFKYHGLRKSWAKFEDADKIDELRREGKQIALKYLGNVLIDVFVSERKENEFNF